MDDSAVIELFDAQRLIPRKDRTALMGAGLLLLGGGALLAHGLTLQQRLVQSQGQSAGLQALSQKQQNTQQLLRASSPELLADLRRQTERLEAELAGQAGAPVAHNLPSQWLVALGELSGAEVGITKAEMARDGAMTLEGQAVSTQAAAAFVAAWERHPRFTGMQARALEIKEQKDSPGLLRFVLRSVPAEVLSKPAGAPSAGANTMPTAKERPAP